MTPDWFYWTYCVNSEEFRKFTITVCLYQPTHKVSLSCNNCEKKYFLATLINIILNLHAECFVKYITLRWFERQNIFLRTNVSVWCSSVQKSNSKNLGKKAKVYKRRRRKKQYIIGKLLQINQLNLQNREAYNLTGSELVFLVDLI